MPMWRRICSRQSWSARWTSWPNMVTRPRVGFSDSSSSLRSEVLPEPEGPVRKWNEPGSMRNGQVPQDFGAVAVAQADIGKLDQASALRISRACIIAAGLRAKVRYSRPGQPASLRSFNRARLGFADGPGPNLDGIVIVCPHCGTRYQLPRRGDRLRAAGAVRPAACSPGTATVPGSAELHAARARRTMPCSMPTRRPISTPRFEAPRSERTTPRSPPYQRCAPATAHAPTPAERGCAAGSSRRGLRQAAQVDAARAAARPVPARRPHGAASCVLRCHRRRQVAAFRTEIVRQFPDLAGFYEALGLGVNVIGLEFGDVTTLATLRDGASVMQVDGPHRSACGPARGRAAGRRDAARRGRAAGLRMERHPGRARSRDRESVDFSHPASRSLPTAPRRVRLTFTDGAHGPTARCRLSPTPSHSR